MKYLIILALIFSPSALAHDRDNPVPITPTEPNNGGSGEGNRNVENFLLGAAAVCLGISLYHKRPCWQSDTVVHFKAKQELPK